LGIRALGRQLLAEYYGCRPDLLDDIEHIRSVMLHAARVSGATIVGEVFHRFKPYGVSGVVVIAESHLAIHTWPEYGYAAVDLFTCGEDVDPYSGFDYLREALGGKRCEKRELTRGLSEDIGRPLRHKPVGSATWG